MLALLTEEQQMLAATAARMAATAEIANPADAGTVGGEDLWRDLAAAGLLGLRSADPTGAPAGSGLDVALVAEALGATLAPVPFVGALLASDLLRRAEAPVALVDALAGGTERCGLLLASDLTRLASVHELSGAVGWEADGAGVVLALLPSAEGARLARVALDGRCRWAPSADLTRPLVRPPADGRLGWEAIGRPLAAEDLVRWEALALASISADAVGVMATALARAVDYARERVQYGVPIGSFQAVQHLCAEAHVLCVGAGVATRYAAWAVDELDPADALRAARVAKAHTGAAAVQVAEISMQVHGGVGQTWEHICHFYARRALLGARLMGHPELHLEHLAEDLRAAG